MRSCIARNVWIDRCMMLGGRSCQVGQGCANGRWLDRFGPYNVGLRPFEMGRGICLRRSIHMRVRKVVVDRRSIAYIGSHLELSPDDLDDVVYLLQSREVVAYLFLVFYNPSPLRCDLHSEVHQRLASLSSHDGSSGSGESARRDGVCQGVDRHSDDFLEQPSEAYLSLSMLALARSCIAIPCTGIHMQRSSV